MKVTIPPIKSQGIKTKLVPWIRRIVHNEFAGRGELAGRWIEPFMGTGVVAFNLAPKHALLCDTNPHLISFYQDIAQITPETVRNYLKMEGTRLLERGESHYYEIRGRFNKTHEPLDFLFLNRAGFNGMIRFNRKGEFNVPFCRKPQRFAQAYITKIVNQISNVKRLLQTKDFIFECQSFEQTIAQATAQDIIYCDPPYIARHADYYNSWNDEHEKALFTALSRTPARFILSTWHHNDFRRNEYIELLWNQFSILTREHFYHVGASKSNRNPIIEAIITNCDTSEYREHEPLMLFDQTQTHN